MEAGAFLEAGRRGPGQRTGYELEGSFDLGCEGGAGRRSENRRHLAMVKMRPIAAAACLSLGATGAHAADAALIAAAKKEGTVVWYTTQIVDQVARPAAQAFEKLYPGMHVTLSRTNATTAAIKILNENRAGKNQSDVFDGTVTVV